MAQTAAGQYHRYSPRLHYERAIRDVCLPGVETALTDSQRLTRAQVALQVLAAVRARPLRRREAVRIAYEAYGTSMPACMRGNAQYSVNLVDLVEVGWIA